jgi:hypothetical protein
MQQQYSLWRSAVDNHFNSASFALPQDASNRGSGGPDFLEQLAHDKLSRVNPPLIRGGG